MATIRQLLETLGLLFVPTSGHTGGVANLDQICSRDLFWSVVNAPAAVEVSEAVNAAAVEVSEAVNAAAFNI